MGNMVPGPETSADVPGKPGRTIKVLAVLLVVLCLILAGLILNPWLLPGILDGTSPDGDGDDANGDDDSQMPDWCDEPPANILTPQWTLDMTQISLAHSRGFDGTGIRIGIVDTGIDISHPEFTQGTMIAWRDFVNGLDEPYDDDGHGTAMASIIAGNHSLTGVAPGVSLIVAKAIPAGGQGTDQAVADAINFCLDPNGDGDYSDGAHIISLSLGGGRHPRFGSASGNAATNAARNGVFVVASAGNDGEDDDGEVESPASEELVIAVGAIDSTGTIASFSSRGNNERKPPQRWEPRQDPNKKPECVAPGVDIVAAFLDCKYATVSGTSPAAAFVSGALALTLQANPGLAGTGDSAAVVQVKSAIMQTSEKMADQAVPHDDWYGYGLIQASDLLDNLGISIR